MKCCFIINPAAGKGITNNDLEQMSSFFKQRLGRFDFVLTQSKADIAIQTRNALKQGFTHIVAVGGDGTIQQVVNGFFDNGNPINPDAALVVSKMGSGSDYFKSIIGNSELKWEDLVLGHQIKAVDLGEVTDLDTNTTEFFVNMTSAGISADIVEKKASMPKWLPGKLKYLIPTLQGLMNYKTEEIELCTDTVNINTQILSLFINKGKFAGGGMKFAGQASLDDGMLEITVVEKISPYKLATNIGRLYEGNFETINEIQKIRTPKLTLSSKNGVKVEMDGEYIGAKNLQISIRPKAINVCFPQS